MTDNIQPNPRDILARKHFPREWEAIANLPGASKRRTQLRQRAEQYEQIEGLRAKGNSCGNCRSYLPAPWGLKFTHYCSAESDYYWYVEAKADGLCHKHMEKRND